ncbi:hypothetical protein DAA51_22720 [Bradyrhizobium sp. WBAH10]|nr:hypothetical protein [Bradyrhizobium sp. WBAH30]MDD1547437.1 hypothetical protein [Bradyrhizobium sp. WBAH41]MDD1561076.1 hypothetical protein [Bradyrhizobium sp. WBAH23]MDD1568518.1 hypothetical protein [Bradyrhizobium sp. WBAH33]MDD1594446.1 hypothetical protein [Bradyrhizobium sp. WBAH42]NRB90999.1 hypothetical protein [Bradyrhizobium sp. WBAH10]QCJ91054.1 hypothetical protein DAA57_22980 [Bradyrhizobium yuanmingense]
MLLLSLKHSYAKRFQFGELRSERFETVTKKSSSGSSIRPGIARRHLGRFEEIGPRGRRGSLDMVETTHGRVLRVATYLGFDPEHVPH